MKKKKKQFSVVDYICQSFIFINKNFIIRSDHSSLYILTTQSTCFCNNNKERPPLVGSFGITMVCPGCNSETDFIFLE